MFIRPQLYHAVEREREAGDDEKKPNQLPEVLITEISILLIKGRN
jgi:hypothetical protein